MLPQVALPLDHPTGAAFLRRFFKGKDVLRLPRARDMEVGQCYENVRTVVKNEGGSIQAGWVLTWLPEHFVEATHHAVWRQPSGELVDVTGPTFPLMTEREINFIADPDTVIGEYDPAKPSLFHQIDKSAGTREYIALTQRRMILTREMFSIVLKLPHWRVSTGWEIPEPHPPKLIHSLSEIGKVDGRRNTYVERFNAGNFAPLP